MYMLRRPGPSTATMAMTRTRNGKVMTASTTRPKSVSSQPPYIADQGPIAVPMTNGNDGGENGDLHVDRGRRADHAREHVAAEIVGAERMRRARRPCRIAV